MAPERFQFECERVLAKANALPTLQTLVDAGCNRMELVSLLEWAFWTDESWQSLVGMDLRTFKGAISEIHHCAGMIDRLNRSELVHHLRFELEDQVFAVLFESPTLSEQLREYASALDSYRGLLGPKRKIRLHVWKARIVATVSEDTKRVYDLEVSTIISAILDLPRYTEKPHQTWRLRHETLIEQMRGQLLQRRGRKAAPPSLPRS